MRKKLALASLALLCALAFTGCAEAATESLPVPDTATLDSVPQNAQLIYTLSAGYPSGEAVTFDTWNNLDDVGYFVVEVLPESGVVKGLQLFQQPGGSVATFGSANQETVFITDIFVDAAGEYALYCDEIVDFSGIFNVYFINDIGYST